MFQGLEQSSAQSSAATSAMDLLSVLQIVEDRLRGIGGFWIKAEVASISEKNGHWYLDLIQKTEGPAGMSAITARVRGIIWRSRAAILDIFAKETGSRVAAGMTIVFHATVEFKSAWGLSLSIDALDSDYTLGRREKERRATIKHLHDSGLDALQRNLILPFLPGRIAVVSSPTAAGWGDFSRHLLDNDFGYVFAAQLYTAVMQGDAAPASIIAAISCAVKNGSDIILILRGGGADSDLFCYDDRALCETICRCPIPVFCAVGHDRDHHICDDVAAASEKTPTALADRIVRWTAEVEADVINLQDSITRKIRERVAAQEGILNQSLFDIRKDMHLAVAMMATPVARSNQGIAGTMHTRCYGMTASVRRLHDGIAASARLRISEDTSAVKAAQGSSVASAMRRLRDMDGVVARIQGAVTFAARLIVRAEDAETEKKKALIEAADPRRILKQGYVLAVDRNGTILKGVNSCLPGGDFILRHIDGRWNCTVENAHADNTFTESRNN